MKFAPAWTADVAARKSKGNVKAQRQRKLRRRREARREPITDKPVATIFADASYFSRGKTGSWGCWIKPDGGPALVKGGPFIGLLTSSVEAEMRALANALALARSSGAAPDGACVMIQSDCQAALSWVLGAVKASDHRPAAGGVNVIPVLRVQRALENSAGLRHFVKIAERAQLKILVRHVRGHKSGGGRQYVNRLVDSVAKKNRPIEKPQEPAHV